MNIKKRLAALENERTDDRNFLTMFDGSTRTIRVRDKFALVGMVINEGRDAGVNAGVIDLLAQSLSIAEADGSHLVEFARAILLSPE